MAITPADIVALQRTGAGREFRLGSTTYWFYPSVGALRDANNVSINGQVRDDVIRLFSRSPGAFDVPALVEEPMPRGEPIGAQLREEPDVIQTNQWIDDDPDVWYGDPVGSSGLSEPVNGQTGDMGAQLVAGAAVVGLAAIVARVAPSVGRALSLWARTFVRGSRVRWDSLPTWVQAVLTGLGLVIGTDLLINEGPGDIGLIQLPGTSDSVAVSGGGDPSVGGTVWVGNRSYEVVSGWQANGVQFWRTRSGHLMTKNKHGVIKVWKPKKPIVLFADGAKDLRTLLKASKAIQKQGKKLATMLRGSGYDVKKS